jgi:hypothetical protein
MVFMRWHTHVVGCCTDHTAGEVDLALAASTLKIDPRMEATLEEAWWNAAFWFHESFSEPLDGVCIVKMERSKLILCWKQ